MNREILFRGKAKTIKPGEWIEGSLVNTYDWYTREQHCFIVDDDYQDHDEWEVIPETVGQYTGKDDCNGKPMFEGDIVKTNLGHIQTIEWSDDYCAFVCIEKGYDKPCQVDILDEIIGNRWDNPELLVTE